MRSKNTGIVAKRQRAVTKAVKAAMRHCVNGCGKGKSGANFCVECGTALPITAGSVAKSAPVPVPAPVTDPLWFGHSADNDPDPAERERAWRQAYDHATKGWDRP